MSTRFDIAVEIQARPERVWAVLVDVERWPEWTVSVSSVQRVDQGPLRVGSRTKVVQPKLRPAQWVVTELDEKAGNFTWANRSPGIQVVGGHRLEPHGNWTRATLSLEFSGLLAPLIVWLYGALSRQYMAAEANGLRARAESIAADSK
jgi:uncharacterized membrane protein